MATVGQTVTYNVSNNGTPAGTYGSWSVSPGTAGTDWNMIPVSNSGLNSIQVQWLTTTFSPYTIAVTATNTCSNLLASKQETVTGAANNAYVLFGCTAGAGNVLIGSNPGLVPGTVIKASNGVCYAIVNETLDLAETKTITSTHANCAACLPPTNYRIQHCVSGNILNIPVAGNPTLTVGQAFVLDTIVPSLNPCYTVLAINNDPSGTDTVKPVSFSGCGSTQFDITATTTSVTLTIIDQAPNVVNYNLLAGSSLSFCLSNCTGEIRINGTTVWSPYNNISSPGMLGVTYTAIGSC